MINVLNDFRGVREIRILNQSFTKAFSQKCYRGASGEDYFQKSYLDGERKFTKEIHQTRPQTRPQEEIRIYFNRERISCIIEFMFKEIYYGTR